MRAEFGWPDDDVSRLGVVTTLTRLARLSLAECEERATCVYGQLAGLRCLERLAVQCWEGGDVRAVGGATSITWLELAVAGRGREDGHSAFAAGDFDALQPLGSKLSHLSLRVQKPIPTACMQALVAALPGITSLALAMEGGAEAHADEALRCVAALTGLKSLRLIKGSFTRAAMDHLATALPATLLVTTDLPGSQLPCVSED